MATPSSSPVTATWLAVDDPRWAAFVESHPDALAFHRPEWAQTLVDCYGYRAFVFGVADHGELVGGLPIVQLQTLGRRRWVGLPFTDLCPPLLAPQVDAAAFTAALDEARRARGVASLEVRSRLDGDAAHHRSDAVIHTTNLTPGADALFAAFHKSQVQRNIRRAERENLVVRRGETARDLTDVYYRLHVQTRRRLGAPVQPRRFFDALWRHMLEPELGRLLLVYSRDVPVAGAVFLAGRGTLTYKFGASDAAFWGLRPNHLLFWSAIRWACETGFQHLDFGRSDLADQGLRDFKSGWGAEEEPLVYTTLAARVPASAPGRSLGAARVVLRKSPAWVCRAAGELLYRYAA
jgi:CelD/BcsL family acetyltransferase involved in cellulose biosynthesis